MAVRGELAGAAPRGRTIASPPTLVDWRHAPRPASLRLADRARARRRRDRRPAPATPSLPRRGRRGGRPRCAALPARRIATRGRRPTRVARHDRGRASRASRTGGDLRPETTRARGGGRRARHARRAGRASDDPRCRRVSQRRLPRRELEQLLPPSEAREFRGDVVVHDAADPDLVELDLEDGSRAAVARALAEADFAVAVSSAETIVRGGPGAFLAACDAATVRRSAGADSLVQAAGEPAWELALAVESALAARRSAVRRLPRPRPPSTHRTLPGLPSRPGVARARLTLAAPQALLAPSRGASTEHPARPGSRPRRDRGFRRHALGRARRGAAPRRSSCARSTSTSRSTRSSSACRGSARTTRASRSTRSRRRRSTLGFAMRLWRDAFPIAADGTLVLVHSLTRSFAPIVHEPYRRLFDALAAGGPTALGAAERRGRQ